MSRAKSGAPKRLSNLYQFIRLILGEKIYDIQIAKRWKMDNKNFYDFKTGKYPLPRVERLVTLAQILKIDDHLVYEVAKGAPAQRIYYLIEKAHLKGAGKLTPRKLLQAYKILMESERRYQKLFHQAGDAMLVGDIKSGNIVHCNQKAELLTGYPKEELIGRHFTSLYPRERHEEVLSRFNRRVQRAGSVKLSLSHILRRDKRLVPVHLTTNIMELDGRTVLQGIFRDASGLKLPRYY